MKSLKINLKKKISLLLKDLKISKNDNVFIHSNSAGIFQFSKKKISLNLLFKYLKKKIGKSGTIVFPTYNYSVLKRRFFSWEELNSEVGYLSNFMLNNKKFQRTKNPVFSHIVNGQKTKGLLNSNNQTAFENNNNFFSKLIKYNFKILGFCCPLNKMTFLHYIEKQSSVPYRFNKKFKLIFKENNKVKKLDYSYFVGKKKIDYSIKEIKVKKILSEKKKILIKTFGRYECWIVKSEDVFKIFTDKLKKNKYYLIK